MRERPKRERDLRERNLIERPERDLRETIYFCNSQIATLMKTQIFGIMSTTAEPIRCKITGVKFRNHVSVALDVAVSIELDCNTLCN